MPVIDSASEFEIKTVFLVGNKVFDTQQEAVNARLVNVLAENCPIAGYNTARDYFGWLVAEYDLIRKPQQTRPSEENSNYQWAEGAASPAFPAFADSISTKSIKDKDDDIPF